MKRTLISLLLVVTLISSAFSFVGCDVLEGLIDNGGTGVENEQKNPTQDGDEKNPGSDNGQDNKPGVNGNGTTVEPPKHTHSYEYKLVSYNGGYALEGICNSDDCDEPNTTLPVAPEYNYIASTNCREPAEGRWTYVFENVTYTYSVFFDNERGEHKYEDGACIYCQTDEPSEPVTPEHTHNWTEATCTVPATCTECGKTYGSEKGHAWSAATCTTPVTCSSCNATSGSANGHAWVLATCTEAKKCSACGEVGGEALGHSFNGKICTTCGISDPSYVEPEAHDHSDVNNDGSCDTCYESVIVILDFYVMNDLHGKFCDTDTQPGVDNLATYIKTRYEYDDNVIVLSSGDMWQGAAESNLTNGIILTEWMNELDFVSMTLGNHEYDWGEEAIRKNLAVAEFPFLAINIYDKTTGKLVDYCTPSVMIERDGLQIGIIGAIGDCYSSISSDQVSNVEFKVGSQLTALVKAESERLRAAGADFIVYSLHDGNGSSNYSASSISSSSLSSYYDVALSSGYVDLVFEAHTHQKYIYYDNYGVYHLQGGGENKGITHVEFKVNSANGNKSLNQAEVVNSSVYSSYAADSATDAIEEKYADVIDKAYTVIGKVSSTQSSSKVADVVSELYLKVGLERWGGKYDIVLGGGFIKTRSPYSLAAGDVTYSDILSLLPFDNQLVLCSIKGTYLKSKFISTSNSSYHNTYSDYGQSVKNNISNNATYYVVVDTYTAFYAPNKLTIVDYYDENVFARDLLADEIKNGRFNLGKSSNYSLMSNTASLSDVNYCVADTVAVITKTGVDVYFTPSVVRLRYCL